MEALLAREEVAHNDVHRAFASNSEPYAVLSHTLSVYREICTACVFADFDGDNARRLEARLWNAHTLAKQYFHRALSSLRKLGDENPVATKQLKKMYKDFIKTSTRFYREHILRIIDISGGVYELEVIAQHIRNDGSQYEASQSSISPALRAVALVSTHQSLIYLGDLSRYRASEHLDKTPDFGPAIGFYGLASSLRPASGLGHHQQAVVALEQRHHFRAIYHLYRAVCAQEPLPNAIKNLKLEFDKVNQAWDRGELIKKEPNDPDAPKHALTGWFVRLQSMCYKGETFHSYEELEREVLSQLSAILRLRALDSALFRIVTVNMAALATVAQDFQTNQTPQAQQAFFYLLRFNMKTFTTLLGLFFDDLREVYRSLVTSDEDELATRLEPVAQRTLPALRMYSCWIMPNLHIIQGLASDDFLAEAIEQFWRTFARTLTLVAAAFPIWDLEELPAIAYILPEDVETLGFLPLLDDKTRHIWYFENGQAKPRFSDLGTSRVCLSDELLSRVKDFLSIGLDLATNEGTTPIKLKGTYIVYGDEPVQDSPLPKKYIEEKPTPQNGRDDQVSMPVQPVPPPKPTSWASVAANGHAKNPNAATKLDNANSVPSLSSHQSRDDQLSRMVDDLVDDDKENDLTTSPRQPPATNSALTPPSGEGSANARNVMAMADWRAAARPPPSRSTNARRPGSPHIAKGGGNPQSTKHATPRHAHATTTVWGNSPVSSSFPSGLPTGTLSSPVHMNGRGHSRVNSANSNRSVSSRKMVESWSSLESTPKPAAGLNSPLRSGVPPNRNASSDEAGTVVPLLFGAGDGVWSTRRTTSFGGNTPRNGFGD